MMLHMGVSEMQVREEYRPLQRTPDVVDEMLAIRAEIENWRSRKESQEANAKYNEMLNNRSID